MKNLTMLSGAGIRTSDSNHKGKQRQIKRRLDPRPSVALLDIGEGEYAYYLHLQPGSVRVKTGDRVRRGQVLARIGASGDAREPHLHFEVTTSPKPFFGEGVPYLIDQYTITPPDGGSHQVHKHELPLNKSIISFRSSTSQ